MRSGLFIVLALVGSAWFAFAAPVSAHVAISSLLELMVPTQPHVPGSGGAGLGLFVGLPMLLIGLAGLLLVIPAVRRFGPSVWLMPGVAVLLMGVIWLAIRLATDQADPRDVALWLTISGLTAAYFIHRSGWTPAPR
jgi:hypothetical protein